ncbi:phosphate ABC transporter permease PstA [Lentimicrobium sp.]|uniref:phosphate ABC transporter permease PstA n=1 Tax=Lentimicrobium sp. TaxID=2034841 RepID=UPI0025E05398|nr:phosphate ABC transporter permease PstA [Lentimicrobium sp.]MCO5255537.1 phosphate ABC transporter permease PstA [Lentimicrobium sp.]MCO5261764.1 phosphate ABC transporter permease PstA [Lentimicrobium sp.]HOP12905.1 phosphate ABC transporter permease PstA [Lentimicrobium sp.]HPF63944.1 phosphate ABC transporter permease PstA [Lentimicrobium sp.]HPJ61660.1 phosphate ABC transporter permease PstA [Lentimicrobium sp.]
MRRFKMLEEKFFIRLSALFTYSLIAVLAFIIIVIFYKGFAALNWDMVFKTPRGGYYYGGEGGVLNAITGSLYISIGATLIAVLIGMPAALYLNVQLIRYRRTQNTIRYFLDALWGIPSIVYGAFGFTLMLFFGMNASLLAGIITVALLISPIMVRTFDEVLCTIPKGMHEASLALGSTRTETAFRIMFKQGFPGFITAVLLSFGRGIGDAASVLFTAGYTDNIPVTLDEPAATLPLAIFFQLGSPIPEVRDRAFAASIILTIIILFISIGARLLSKRYSKTNLK